MVSRGRSAFRSHTAEATAEAIRYGAHTIPPGTSPECRSFIISALRVNPTRRVDASDLLLHPWILEHCPAAARHAYRVMTRDNTARYLPSLRYPLGADGGSGPAVVPNDVPGWGCGGGHGPTGADAGIGGGDGEKNAGTNEVRE